MKKNRYLLFVPVVFLLMLCACTIVMDTASTSVDFDAMVAQTAAVAMTQTAASSPRMEAGSPQAGANLPEATAGPTVTPAPDYRFPPDVLPAANTGYIFKAGECWDLDNMQPVIDTLCDLAIDRNGILTPRNQALISGVGRLDAPYLEQCQSDAVEQDPAAPLTDMYLCFQTNKGMYGFLVLREDSMLKAQQMVFDVWLFAPPTSP